MAYLVELPVSGAGDAPGSAPVSGLDAVKVEIEEISEGLVNVARPGQVVARASRSLHEMLAGIRPVAQNFVDTFRGMSDRPDEIGVEFGLSLSAEADVVISRTTGQANFKVTLTWHRPVSPDGAAAGTAPQAGDADATIPSPSPGTRE
ncbi:CU044_2847 family protein [Streptomyces violascens]|uniref:CU044_2847 family protein n=1 Tax=Streptomyces violascens TaxID=67381 RepID=UPI003665DD84